MAKAAAPCIYVIAGTNGAGKSSVAGAAFRLLGADYFNPDEATRQIRAASPKLPEREANIAAWLEGKRLLETAIANRCTYAFESTLGGNTITGLLLEAAAQGIEVRVWYVALASAELHLARVRARVKRGGHNIPEATVRARYDGSRKNLIRLLPYLTELRLFDNSVENDPAAGAAPNPLLVMHVAEGAGGDTLTTCPPASVPAWAKPIVAAALKSVRPSV